MGGFQGPRTIRPEFFLNRELTYLYKHISEIFDGELKAQASRYPGVKVLSHVPDSSQETPTWKVETKNENLT